ncbi:signal peptide peptidase SppA [Rurimicrobium arvi]|uniref:Signal peptide peptidase SppA n=1 Tax=Rurimicrobium arvi TaxID=2049916 RepID=A0ABP8MXY9_9BACT
MKQFFKMFFASLLGAIVASVIIVALSIGAIIGLATKAASTASESETAIKENSVLKLDIGKTFHEQGVENAFAFMGAEDDAASGIYEITQGLKVASKDSKIKGLMIRLAPSPNSFATLEQLRAAIVEFKKSGKFVYAYGESLSQGALYLASAADSVFVNPAGDVELKGLVSQIPFFKNTLAKLEIEPEIFYAGKFKSATEPFRADKMSEPNRLQLSAIQTDIWNEMITRLAEHAKSDTAAINQLAQTGAIQFPQDALDHKLIDGIRYWDQVETMLKAKLDVKEKKEISYASFDDLADKDPEDNDAKDGRVAVIFAEGQISDGEANGDYEITDRNLVQTIRKVRDADKVKAVVLRVNSPGGSARASEIILRELQLLHKKKPVVVSMGDVAASGGYYISCAADSVFAMPTTITGSIGVFSMMFNTEKLMNNKLGITFDEVKNAPYADFPNGMRKMTPEEGAMMQRSVDTIYAIFKRHVAEARKMNVDDVDSIAQGRVWTGKAAMGIGLVDGLGNLDRAVRSAAALAKINDYEVRTYPEKVDKLKSLMRRIKGGSSSEEAIAKAIVKEMGSVNARELMTLKQFYNMNGRSMALMPFRLTIR